MGLRRWSALAVALALAASAPARARTTLTLGVEAEQDRAVARAPTSLRSALTGSLTALYDDGRTLRLMGAVHAVRDREAPERDRIGIREISGQIGIGDVELRAGRQFIRWGRLDALRAIDPFRRRDLADPLDDADESIWAASATVYRGGYAIEAVWVPFFQGDRIPYDPKSPWCYFPGQTVGEGGQVVAAVYDEGRVRAPGDGVAGSEVGLRIDASPAGYDLGLSFSRAAERIPATFAVVGTSWTEDGALRATVDPSYATCWMAGIDGAWPLGDGTVRAEAALLAPAQGDARGHFVRGGVGADWPFDGLVAGRTVDLFVTYAFDGGSGRRGAYVGEGILATPDCYRHPFRHAVVARASMAASSTLALEAETLRDLQAGDAMLSCAARWSPANGLEIEGELRWVGGPDAGFLGRYDAYDTARLRARYAWSTSLPD